MKKRKKTASPMATLVIWMNKSLQLWSVEGMNECGSTCSYSDTNPVSCVLQIPETVKCLSVWIGYNDTGSETTQKQQGLEYWNATQTAVHPLIWDQSAALYLLNMLSAHGLSVCGDVVYLGTAESWDNCTNDAVLLLQMGQPYTLHKLNCFLWASPSFIILGFHHEITSARSVLHFF